MNSDLSLAILLNISRVACPEDSAFYFVPGAKFQNLVWNISKRIVDMKKMISALALCAFITASFTGCGGEEPKKSTPAPTGGKEAAKETPKEGAKK